MASLVRIANPDLWAPRIALLRVGLRRWLGRLALLAFATLAVLALQREVRALQAAEGARAMLHEAVADAPASQRGMVARSDAALVADARQPGLVVTLRLGRRRVHQTAFTLALERSGEPLVPLIGHSEPDGRAGPLRLPPGLEGRYDVTVRAPGFLPAQALDVELGQGVAVIDFSAGGVTPLRAGDIDADARIDRSDALLWLRRRNDPAFRSYVDVDGDGEVRLADLRLLWANRSSSP